MSHDCPPLDLDDLVHLISPSTAPQSLQDDPDLASCSKSTSPELLPDADIIEMRKKVVEMRQIDKADRQLTTREKELVDMVLKLTASVRPDPDQLLRQADVISALIQQRDLLLHQTEEQRLRWNSEKDGWARMAEALLAQQAKNRLNSEHDEDSGRTYAAETDNKGLRQRLSETQSRLQILESELTRLRPLLLMQPLISRSPMPLPTPNPKTPHARRRKKDSAATEDEDHAASEDEPIIDLLDTPSHTSHSQPTPKLKLRKSEAPNIVHPLTNLHKQRQKATSRGLSADARAEHLLLAARKIGKHRAGIMSGMTQHLEERERERRREESATTAVAITPKTPKRNTSHMGYPSEGGFVYMNSQMRPGRGMQSVPLFVPAYPHHILQTPSSSTTAPSVTSSAQPSAQKSKQGASTNYPPTPLDSLLSAARSMMREDIDVEVDEDEEVDVVGDTPRKEAGARHARSTDMLGSPVPKRRKVAARPDKLTALHESVGRAMDKVPSSSATTAEATNAGVGRVRSALDVLADQAAAFSTQEQSPFQTQTQTQTQTEDKGKERADTQRRDPSTSTPRPRGRTKSRRELEADAPSSTAPTPASRSGTPRSDSGDNPTRSAHAAHPQAGEPVPQAQVDAGGGTSSASTSVPSSQMLDSQSVSEVNQVTTNNDAKSPRLPDTSPHVDESADATPRQVSRIQGMLNEEESDGAHAVIAQPNLTHLPAPPLPEIERGEASPPPEPTPPGGENDGIPGSGPATSTAPAKNKELVRVTEQDMPPPISSTKRQRSPYVKWSKEEDDLLAQAVAKHGQKWDLVQRALPSRGYHQVRQRWLRKLGVFDSKPDLSSFQTGATTFPSTSPPDGVEPRGNPKLGLAPLSSERAFPGLVGRPPSLPS